MYAINLCMIGIYPTWVRGEQHDAHEFIMSALSYIEDEMSRYPHISIAIAGISMQLYIKWMLTCRGHNKSMSLNSLLGIEYVTQGKSTVVGIV